MNEHTQEIAAQLARWRSAAAAAWSLTGEIVLIAAGEPMQDLTRACRAECRIRSTLFVGEVRGGRRRPPDDKEAWDDEVPDLVR